MLFVARHVSLRSQVYLIKQALGMTGLQMRMTRPFSPRSPVPKVMTSDDRRVLWRLFTNLPPSRQGGILRAMQARMRATR
jgi:hypothetical protein